MQDDYLEAYFFFSFFFWIVYMYTKKISKALLLVRSTYVVIVFDVNKVSYSLSNAHLSAEIPRHHRQSLENDDIPDNHLHL